MISIGAYTRRKIISILDSKSTLKLLQRASFCGLKDPGNKNAFKSAQYSTDNKQKEGLTKSDRPSGEVSTAYYETVKETTKTAYYGSIILAGLGITGIIFYTIFRELFSGNSPNRIYSKALDRCIADERVQIALGEPIKGFGEETRRGRRRHTSHLIYEKDGVNYLRMKFYLKGIRRKGTVHLEMKENEKKKFEYRYLFVQLEEYPHTTIILEDNRNNESSVLSDTSDSLSLLQ